MYRYRQTDQGDFASGVNVLAGLWLVLSAWIFGIGPGDGTAWNSIIVGIVIAAFAAARLSGGIEARGFSWINAVLGAWMIVAPFVFGYAANAPRTWNSVIVGIIVLVLALTAASEEPVAGARSRDRWYGAGSGWPVWAGVPGSRGWAETGWRAEGRYRGVGPKGYRRSDEQVRDDVCARMTDDDRLDAADIEVRVAAGEATLQGTVPDRYSRRLAEELVDGVPGVREVRNELRVRGPQGAEAPRRIA